MKIKDTMHMYSFEGHIVQIIKNDGSVIIGYADGSETDFDNDIGDAMNLDTDCVHLPYNYPARYYPVTVFTKDIKDIEIIE